MAYLHNDREQFKDAIYLAYDQTGIMVQAIEKDYYVTMLLKLLSEKIPYIVFKGGTSLSKCHKVIKRFSEDIDQEPLLLSSSRIYLASAETTLKRVVIWKESFHLWESASSPSTIIMTVRKKTMIRDVS